MSDQPPRAGLTRGYFPRYSAEPLMFDNGVVGHPTGSTSVPRSRTVVRADEELTRIAQRALLEEPDVPRGITMHVANGHLTLDGCVQTFYQRACVERALHFVDGVHSIDNRITVKPIVSASNIKLHILEQLQAEVLNEAYGIEVHVQESHVTISGAARSMAERRCVEDSVRSAPGVQTVDNQLRVTS